MTNDLKHIFTPSDNIYSCNMVSDGTPCDVQIGKCADLSVKNFYCINPIKSSYRRKTEIKAYRNFLFECDSMPIEQQMELLPVIAKLELVRMVTYSGGKSLHYIVSCGDTLDIGEPGTDAANDNYRQIWLGLERMLNNAGLTNIDQSNKNPVTLSRFPEATRENGNVQKMLYIGNFVDHQFLNSVKVASRPQTVQLAENVKDYDELEAAMSSVRHAKLAGYLKNPLGWISPGDGNYPRLFRYSIWAIDSLNPEPSCLLKFIEKYTVPFLHKRAYYKDWKKPVLDAYRHKGLL